MIAYHHPPLKLAASTSSHIRSIFREHAIIHVSHNLDELHRMDEKGIQGNGIAWLGMFQDR